MHSISFVLMLEAVMGEMCSYYECCYVYYFNGNDSKLTFLTDI